MNHEMQQSRYIGLKHMAFIVHRRRLLRHFSRSGSFGKLRAPCPAPLYCGGRAEIQDRKKIRAESGGDRREKSRPDDSGRLMP
jgi:hypothetical protein